MEVNKCTVITSYYCWYYNSVAFNICIKILDNNKSLYLYIIVPCTITLNDKHHGLIRYIDREISIDVKYEDSTLLLLETGWSTKGTSPFHSFLLIRYLLLHGFSWQQHLIHNLMNKYRDCTALPRNVIGIRKF